MKIVQSIKSFLNPEFMQKTDHYLLINYPRIWSSRIHYIAYYGLLANVILNLLVLIFLQPHQIDEFINIIILIVMIIEVVAFIFWLVKQNMFNLEQQYGNTYKTDGLLVAFLYTVCTLIIISSSITMTYIGIHKTAHIVSINQQSVQEMNSKICKSLNQILISPYSYENNRYFKNELKYIMNVCNEEKNFNIYPIPNDYSLLKSYIDYLNRFYNDCNQLHCKLDDLEYIQKGIFIYYHYENKFLPLFSPQNRQENIKRRDNSKQYLEEIEEKMQHNTISNPENSNIKKEYLYELYPAYNIYQDIYEFIMNYDEPSNLYYHNYLLLHVYFICLGLLIFTPIKYSSWINLLWIALYIFILFNLFSCFALLVNTLKINLFPNFLGFPDKNKDQNDIICFFFLLTLLISYLSLKLTTVKKIKNLDYFFYINFFTLPIAVIFIVSYSLLLLIDIFNVDIIFWRVNIILLSVLFLLYLFLFPFLQKTVLKRFMSLPKE